MTCQWEYDKLYDTYLTSCGNDFHFAEGSLKSNCFYFCPFCGKVINDNTMTPEREQDIEAEAKLNHQRDMAER